MEVAPLPEVLFEYLPEHAPTLFHYTNPAGLLGILTYKQLWLSNVAFLNDAEKYSYGLNLIKQVIKDEYDEDLFLHFHFNQLSPTFSMSLTENGDLLSQWRGYCPNGGYSLAFDKEQLSTMLKQKAGTDQKWLSIGPCIYDEEKQRDLIKFHILDNVLSSVGDWRRFMERERVHKAILPLLVDLSQKEREERLSANEQAQLAHLTQELERVGKPNNNQDLSTAKFHMLVYQRFEMNLRKYIGLLKHPAFAEEKEWRIFYSNQLRTHPLEDENIEYREGKSTLIPYLKIQLAHGDECVRIVKAFVSPGPQQELARISCKALLRKHKSPEADVQNSEIPYRTW